ncbi:hypothetical protein HHI36_014349 [Cryptolaemus montrouzieri]|uniref:Uncharacterized protein n=1 Tax=Cryptolaemus montrouzieri TaxID=559131 RepID=A0ABD2N2I9_9CUCU
MISHWIPTKPNFYIIEEDNFEKLEDIFLKLSSLSTLPFNPRAKYLFIGQNVRTDFLKFLFSVYITDVIILNPENLDLWSPFHHEKGNVSWNIYSETHNGVKCTNGSKKQNTVGLHPRKIEGNWGISKISVVYKPVEMYSACHNCTRKGILLEMFEIIADHLNIKVEYYPFKNISKEEIFLKHTVAIRPYGIEVFNFTEFTMSCLVDELSWFVPFPKLIPRWRYLQNIFEPYVWLLFF